MSENVLTTEKYNVSVVRSFILTKVQVIVLLKETEWFIYTVIHYIEHYDVALWT